MNSVSRTNEVTVELRTDTGAEQTIRLTMTYSDCDAMAVPEVYASAEADVMDQELLEAVTDFACQTRNVQMFMTDSVVHLSARLVKSHHYTVDDAWVIERGHSIKMDEIITVSVNESHIGDGLPNRQEAWQKYYDIATKRLKEAESTLEERKRIVAALLQVNPKVSHANSLKQAFYGNRDWIINLDDPPQ